MDRQMWGKLMDRLEMDRGRYGVSWATCRRWTDRCGVS